MQEDLEHLSGVATRHISRIENGRQSVGIDRYIKVALALRVPLSRLFDDTESHSGGGEQGVASPGEQGGDPKVIAPSDTSDIHWG